MQRYDFYFKQPVSEAELDAAFAGAETAIWNGFSDRRLAGIVSGFVPSAVGAWVLSVSAGKGIDKNGARLFSSGPITLDPRTDTAGASTVPPAGQRRWVSVYARFGRNLSDPRTDGLLATVQFNRAEALNPDDVQAHVGRLLVVAAAPDLIGNPLPTRPAAHASAILLGDILLTDGDSALVAGAIDTSRAERLWQPTLFNLPTSGEFQGTLPKPVQLVALPITASIYSRQFATPSGFALTHNANWDGIARKWFADDGTVGASRLTLRANGLYLQTRTATSSNWDDTESPTGWDSGISLYASTDNSFLSIPTAQNTIMSGRGSQTVLWAFKGEVAGNGGVVSRGHAVTFPSVMTPSSVTVAGGGSLPADLIGDYDGVSHAIISGTGWTVTMIVEAIQSNGALISAKWTGGTGSGSFASIMRNVTATI